MDVTAVRTVPLRLRCLGSATPVAKRVILEVKLWSEVVVNPTEGSGSTEVAKAKPPRMTSAQAGRVNRNMLSLDESQVRHGIPESAIFQSTLEILESVVNNLEISRYPHESDNLMLGIAW